MSRLTSLARLSKRRVYAGCDYREGGRRREMTGAQWFALAGNLRAEWNGDCIAVYDRAELVYEIWETAREIAA